MCENTSQADKQNTKVFYYFKCNQVSDREKHLCLSPAKSILMPQADAVPRIHKY